MEFKHTKTGFQQTKPGKLARSVAKARRLLREVREYKRKKHEDRL